MNRKSCFHSIEQLFSTEPENFGGHETATPNCYPNAKTIVKNEKISPPPSHIHQNEPGYNLSFIQCPVEQNRQQNSFTVTTTTTRTPLQPFIHSNNNNQVQKLAPVNFMNHQTTHDNTPNCSFSPLPNLAAMVPNESDFVAKEFVQQAHLEKPPSVVPPFSATPLLPGFICNFAAVGQPPSPSRLSSSPSSPGNYRFPSSSPPSPHSFQQQSNNLQQQYNKHRGSQCQQVQQQEQCYHKISVSPIITPSNDNTLQEPQKNALLPPSNPIHIHSSSPISGSSDEEGLYNSGQWTREEHGRFLEGLKMYGRNWKVIATNFVRTRSRVQVASHAQTYFLKLQKRRSYLETEGIL